jgi:hypothetical protein
MTVQRALYRVIDRIGASTSERFHKKIYVMSDCINFDYHEFSQLFVDSEFGPRAADLESEKDLGMRRINR